MPIISRIGRRSLKVRALLLGMYAFLLLGSATMVYPFLLMVSGSTKSAVDISTFDVIPRFLREDVWLYRKHVEALFNERLADRNMAYDDDALAFDTVTPPAAVRLALVQEWTAFLKQAELPAFASSLGHLDAPVSRTIPLELRRFKRWLAQRYGPAIADVNRALGTEFAGWNSVAVVPQASLGRGGKRGGTAFDDAVNAFKAAAPDGLTWFHSPEGFFRKQYLRALYTAEIAAYNKAHGTAYASYAQVSLSSGFPAAATALEREDWETFVRRTLASQWIKADPAAQDAYAAFLRAKYGSLAALNHVYGTSHPAFESVPLVAERSAAVGLPASDWDAFIAGWRDPASGVLHALPREHLRICSTETLFREHLRGKYDDVEALNRAMGTAFAGFEAVPMPQAEAQYLWFLQHKVELRAEFLTRNYKAVADYVLLHGRGIVNTVVYCSLAILLALVVNPLAAYAMSRYRLPSSYKILFFLMCTMAFPPMVTQIPNFLMLRRLGLLNTFAALLLPGMASGYAIFLLKGFFDAQPRELYESAQLDGAGEWTIFWQITMSLSKPILAVIALQAFTAAYSNFMFAFVVCQDERMWTLMVWLYQLQQRSGQAVMYASLIIAAIPTFLIFLSCQNIIMRGIVVPSEK